MNTADLSTTLPVSTKGPLNRRSLGFARDDKGKGNRFMESGCRTAAFFITLAFSSPWWDASARQPLFMKQLPFPLSSRAKPRDLRFSGPFAETGSVVERSALLTLLSLATLCPATILSRSQSRCSAPDSKKSCLHAPCSCTASCTEYSSTPPEYRHTSAGP